MIKQLLLVAVGGGAGSVLRYLSSVFTAKYYAAAFPLATFLVNIAGCFVIGVLSGLLLGHSSANTNLKLLLITGFCGGYTTFSTFAMENFYLLNYHYWWVVAAYIAASVILGIAAVWLGIILGTSFH